MCLCEFLFVFVSMGFCVCSDVCVCVCVVMGLNRLIGVSWVCVWLLCVEPVPKVKGEREEKKKKTVGKPRKTKVLVRKK